MIALDEGFEARIVSIDTDSAALSGPFLGEALVTLRPDHVVFLVDRDALQQELDREISSAFDQGAEQGEEDARFEMRGQIEDLEAEIVELKKKLDAASEALR
jgi:hypothetical protein